MRSQKVFMLATLVLVIAAYFAAGFFRQWSERREAARLERVLAPVITKAVEGSPDPKPELDFIVTTEKSIQVVLRWGQNPEAVIKNDMRERVSTSVRREMAADPKGWGKYMSVIFSDEVVTQGWK